METEPRILRPRARYPVEPNSSTGSSGPSTPTTSEEASSQLDPSSSTREKDDFSSVSRNQSILNLTSPALLGIYSPTAFDSSTTPFESGVQTPALRANGFRNDHGMLGEDAAKRMAALQYGNKPRKHGFVGYVVPLVKRSVLLFVFGVVYGVIITHLHHADPRMTPITIEDVVDSGSWQYMAFWGAAGVALGNLLPWFDGVWDGTFSAGHGRPQGYGSSGGAQSGSPRSVASLAADWSPMVRSIGAFVGIAFAIRKLPWQSTLQVSLTLSLANPVLWYLLDRSKPGFILSLVVGLTGMMALLNINPEIVPSPAASMQDGGSVIQLGFWPGTISHESIAVATWIASVLFCSCVCFGNIGRRLAS